MLADPKLKILNDLVRSSTKDEMAWIHGYLSGILANTREQQQQPSEQSQQPSEIRQSQKKITLAYGTETGNSKKLATDFADVADLKLRF